MESNYEGSRYIGPTISCPLCWAAIKDEDGNWNKHYFYHFDHGDKAEIEHAWGGVPERY